MNLLKYEFMNSPEGSYNYILGQFIKTVRHYRTNVPIEEFTAAIPELRKSERLLQNIDETMGEERRNYLEEVMEELEQESAIESQLLEEIELSSRAIASALYDTDFSMDAFAFVFRNSDAINWIEFYGYKEQQNPDGALLVVKEVFRSVCYKFGIAFIDCSLTKD